MRRFRRDEDVARTASPVDVGGRRTLRSPIDLNARVPRPTPNTALHDADNRHTRYARLHVPGSGVLNAIAKTDIDHSRVVVAGQDTLKIIRITNRAPDASPVNSFAPTPVQRSHSDRGTTRKGRPVKTVGPGGTTMEEVMNVWSGSKLGLTHATMDVAWGHQIYANKIVTAAINGQCILWDINRSGSSKVETYLTEHTRPVNRVAFHTKIPHYLLSGGTDGYAKLWDLRQPFKSAASFRHGGPIQSLCFTPMSGSQQCVIGLEGGAIQRWDLRKLSEDSKGMLDWIQAAHVGSVLDVQWREYGLNQDWGTWMVSCGMDKTVKIWDMSSSTMPRAPRQVLHTATPNRRVAWRPGFETEVVVVPHASGNVACSTDGLDAGDFAQPEALKITIWDVRRNRVPKYVLDGGVGAPTGIVFTGGDFDSVVTTYRDSFVVQHDFRHHERPIEKLPRNALSWDAAGRLIFAAEDRKEREIPFDEPPYDPHTRLRTYGSIEQSCKGPRYTPVSQVAAGYLIPGSNPEAFGMMARGYVLDKPNKWEACAINVKVAWQAGHVRAAQAWQLLHSILLPLPLPSPSPSPHPLSTPAKSSKYSFSPLSGSSRRAASVGPPRSTPRRGTGTRNAARPPAARRATNVTLPDEGGRSRSNSSASSGSLKHVGEGALEDSDSEKEADRTDGGASEEQLTGDDTPPSPIISRHHRNQSESSLAAIAAAAARSPLSRTTVTAGQIASSSTTLRRLPEGEEDSATTASDADHIRIRSATPMDPPTDTDTAQDEAGSSSSGRASASKPKSSRPRRLKVPQSLAELVSHTPPHSPIHSTSASGKRRNSNGGSHRPRISDGRSPERERERERERGRRRTRRVADVLSAEKRVREIGWAALREAVDAFIAEGDVQTCATLAIVAGEQLVSDEGRILRIITAYLDLLSRRQLFTSAAYVRKHAPSADIREITSSGTTFAASCARCGRSLRGQKLQPGEPNPPGNFAFCTECKRHVSHCAICHLPTKGLFFVCQVCGHGGHEECYREYYLSQPMTAKIPLLYNSTPFPPLYQRPSYKSSADSAGSATAEEDARTGRSRTVKQRDGLMDAGMSEKSRPRSMRVHPIEAGDDSEEEKMKSQMWMRRSAAMKRTLMGHPCVAGCGHTCWIANDRRASQ